ncbi:ABC transporter C family member 10 [Selaginella moellendorffii]|uniref:ABC transporter C family member 10 n=1 Tax=Selaginella moellendorffii TaxID=88036 RepID=UPI000D1C2AA1|nr:ABC transporter C family member 10 [Selaginella moellendorffii]|eukprot:XP_024541088.1 ABC transporter C family member 10 [Selaginella moellendorffii]
MEGQDALASKLSPFSQGLWHWVVSGLHLFFLAAVALGFVVSIKTGAGIFGSHPVPRQWLASFLAILIGIAHWSILGGLLQEQGAPRHDIAASIVQGVAWIVLSFTAFMKPSRGPLIAVLRSWWSVNFILGTFMAVYAGHAIVRHNSSSQTLVALASWPVCCVLLSFSGTLNDGFECPSSATLSEPFLASSSSSARDTENLYHVHCSTYESAGCLSRVCFTWLNPLFSLGNSRPLKPRDIPNLGQEDKAEASYNLFAKVWSQEKLRHPQMKPSLRRVLTTCFWRRLAWNGFYALFKSAMLSAGPLVMKVFIDYAQGKIYFKYEGYVLVLALLVAKLAESVAQRLWYFGSRRIGMHVRSALIGAIYQKELRLSSIGKDAHAGGEVVSYMAVDAYRIGEFPFWFHLLWSTPLQIIFALIILFYSMGLATVAGIVILILTMVINAPMASLQQKYQNELMEAQDERLRATSEVLRHMKIVKLQAWEEKFRSMIDKLREVEINGLSALQYRKTYNALVFWLSPILVSTATFAARYMLGKPLTASNIFTALATFRIIQEPIRAVPDVVAILVQVRVSLARIEKFLQDDELDTHAVIRGTRSTTEHAIQMTKALLSWNGSAGDATLRNINLTVKHGGRVAICGEVGSGKSTFICSILGETPKLAGIVQVCGTVAYVPQIAWIQSGTIRENILFGLPMDEQRYRRTLKACALDKDLENFTFRDLTEIGERGINISGGQKQRIQLARAVYQDADIYLLDDPFSAVDAHTCSALFKNCIMGLLAKKTVVLVTHQVEFLPAFDTILLLKDGEICQAGKFNELLQPGSAFEELVNAHNEVMGIMKHGSGQKSSGTPPGSAAILLRKLSSAKSLKDSYVLDEVVPDQLTKEEERETGDSGAKPYLDYLGQARGFLYCSLAALSHIVFAVGQLSSNWWLAAEVGNKAVGPGKLIGVYAAIGLSTVSFLFLRSVFIVIMGIAVSKSFFSGLKNSLFQAPMAFFDSTPSGRILSRVSVDMSIVDVDFPFSLCYFIAATVNALSNLAVTASVTWQLLVIIIPMLYLNRVLQTYYMASARELNRINGITKSPILNYFGEAITGAGTIRAFQRQEQFMRKILSLVDGNCGPFFYSFAANEWLVLRLEALCTAVVCSSALIMVLLPPGKIDPGFVGLAISYGLSLNVSLVFSIQHQCTLSNYSVSVERIKQYLGIPSEAPATIEGSRLPALWPARGRVELKDLQISYRPDCPLVLRGITCTFEGGQKVGVVGRSGSGKTTLITALFRIAEPVDGQIAIDGIDISTIGLRDLRSRLSIIPQEPTLFRGTVRFNLDPEGLYTDLQIWEALDKCHLGESVREKAEHLDAPVGDDGENWSVGQRQLFCLGRVLLKNSRILILDEATASIDNATDAVLQKLLREEFAVCTVITVAHRIPTVVDSDMVLALSDGILAEFDQPLKLLENKTSLFAKLVAEYWSNSSPGGLERKPSRSVSFNK